MPPFFYFYFFYFLFFFVNVTFDLGAEMKIDEPEFFSPSSVISGQY